MPPGLQRQVRRSSSSLGKRGIGNIRESRDRRRARLPVELERESRRTIAPGGEIRSGSGPSTSVWRESAGGVCRIVSGCVGEGRKPLVTAGSKDQPSGVTAFSWRAGTGRGTSSGRSRSRAEAGCGAFGEKKPASGTDQRGPAQADHSESMDSVRSE